MKHFLTPVILLSSLLMSSACRNVIVLDDDIEIELTLKTKVTPETFKNGQEVILSIPNISHVDFKAEKTFAVYYLDDESIVTGYDQSENFKVVYIPKDVSAGPHKIFANIISYPSLEVIKVEPTNVTVE